METLNSNDILKRIFVALPILCFVLLIGTFGYRWLSSGHVGYLDGLYMTVISITTVGYHEVVDTSHNPAARVFTIILILFGVGILLYVLSLVTAFFVEGELVHLFWRRKMEKTIIKLDNHIIICGAGKMGASIIKELYNEKTKFVVVDINEDRLKQLQETIGSFPFVVGDGNGDEILEKAGIHVARGLITTISNDQDNLYITLSARALNQRLHIVSRATDISAKSKLLRAGANSVVTPDQIGAIRMLSELESPTVAAFFESVIFDPIIPYRFGEYTVTSNSKLHGKRLKEVNLREHLNINLVALHDRSSGRYIPNPEPNITIQENMTLILLGEKEKLSKLHEIY